MHAVAAQPIRRFAHPSVADAAANNGYVHPRADRLRRRPDHWYFTVHPPGLAGDLFRRRATRPGDSAQAADSGGAVVVAAKRSLSETLRPYLVIGGLVLSFSLVTLLGSALLSLLHLPQDAIRWVALAALVAIGLGLIFPRFEQLLERPFTRIPQMRITTRRNGFGLGLALGVLYVPCAARCWPRSSSPGHREHRRGSCRAHRGVRGGHRGAVVVLRFGRPAGGRTGQCFSAASA
ncbi:dipZ domain protein [Mycobacterium xenopi 4042]|uniref:DipZ domain protein n=1 Tax=Mycobacterium xenopi 4042 TaxID=1299334 RepID=X8DLE2_MYCXE|nr:dipZ domain protein [Mycobacterium xenopi 4042]